jgi:hypothetical protein
VALTEKKYGMFCRIRSIREYLRISIQQLKAAAAELSDAERRELISYLVSLGREKTSEYWDRLTTKIADRDTAHWVHQDDLHRVLRLDDAEA